jgi:hypothetical protein
MLRLDPPLIFVNVASTGFSLPLDWVEVVCYQQLRGGLEVLIVKELVKGLEGSWRVQLWSKWMA